MSSRVTYRYGVKIVVTGSIATDYLMVFPGRFKELILADKLDEISLSFLVDELQIKRGGIGANIAFSLGCLGLSPTLVGAVGPDFLGDYGVWLKEHGVDVESVRVSDTRHTARFLCTTDADHNQIASFYSGAMEEAREIDLREVVERLGGVDIVLIAPDDPAAMLRHTQVCREEGWPFAADPSQQLARMEGPDIRQLIDGATWLFANSYEHGLMEHKTGWTAAEIASRVEVTVLTHGPRGVTVQRRGQDAVTILPPQERAKCDPTGVGDGFRSGFLAGMAWGLDDATAAQVGCLVATLVIEAFGTQEHDLSRDSFCERFAEAYGREQAALLQAHL